MKELSISQMLKRYLDDAVHHTYQVTVGKVLTIVDAISDDSIRRKAIHDLAEQTIWSEAHRLHQEVKFVSICLREKLKEPKPEFNEGEPSRQNIFDK